MDFKRIQVIFLITFVIIDVFLFSLFHRNENVQTDDLNSGNQTNVVAEMHNDQISFHHRPSGVSGTGYYVAAKKTNGLHNEMQELANQNSHYNGGRLISTFKHPVALNRRQPHLTINRKLNDPTFILHGDQYHYSSDLSSRDELVYVQQVPKNAENQDVFSKTAEIKFRLNDHYLEGYTQEYVNHVKTLHEKLNTISEKRALTWLYQYNNIPNNTKIEWCHFAYTRLLSVKGNRVYIPTWVIALKTNNSPVHYRDVNAFTGSIIKHRNLSNNSKALG